MPNRTFTVPQPADKTHTGFATEQVNITPEMAVKWLEKNLPSNRPVNSGHVDNLAREMRTSRWKLNGETIKFDVRGHLIDGQHRLRACIRANTPFTSLVARDLDTTAFDTIDLGRRRTNGQILGIYGEKNSNDLAAALRFLWYYRDGDMRAVSGGHRSFLTPQDIHDLLEREGGIRESMPYTKMDRHLMPTSLSLFCHYICAEKDRHAANEFFESLKTGAMLSSSSPIYKLREKLVKIAGEKNRRNKLEICAWVIIAFNMYRKKSHNKRIAWDYDSDTPFPKLL